MLPPHLVVAVGTMPPVPSRTLAYNGASTTTTDETTTTFSSVNIGTPHPKRVVILAVYHGVGAACTTTVNGINAYHRTQNTAHEFSMHLHQVPHGTTASITISATGSVRKALMTYVFYPQDHAPLDSGTATANTTTNANVADQKNQFNGCVIYVGGQNATLGTFTTTWNAAGTLAENVDAQLESVASYTSGNVTAPSSSDTGDVDMGESVSGTKRLVVTTLRPPPNGGGGAF